MSIIRGSRGKAKRLTAAVALKAELEQAEAEGRKPRGRPRTKPIPEKLTDFRETMEGEAYAFYLKDLAEAARAELGPGPVVLYQDNVSWHKSPPCPAAMQAEGITVLGEPPARSPDLNNIENLCGHATQLLDELWVEKRPKNAAETLQRFLDICSGLEESGYVANLADRLPARFAECIANDGGPTRW